MKTEVYPALSLPTQLTLPLGFLYANKEESFSWTGRASSSASLYSKNSDAVSDCRNLCLILWFKTSSFTDDYYDNFSVAPIGKKKREKGKRKRERKRDR